MHVFEVGNDVPILCHVFICRKPKNEKKTKRYVVIISYPYSTRDTIKTMHLFLVWRAMEDRLSTIGYTIERCLWGDSRARHTYLIACTDEHPLVLIEIDMGDHSKGIHKSMKLKITELEELPDTIVKLVYIGETLIPNALTYLLQSAEKYVKEHPNYHVLSNNCRTFVEYLIDQIPSFVILYHVNMVLYLNIIIQKQKMNIREHFLKVNKF